MPRNEGIFTTRWNKGTPVFPTEEEMGFPILGYSVFEQHVNANHNDVKFWARLPEENHKNQLKAFLPFVKDHGGDETFKEND